MAIIYSYPTVTPTKTDLILGTDVSTTNKATKNFTVQSIVDIVTAGAVGIGATIKLTNPLGNAADPVSGANQPIINLSNITGSGTSTFPTFTTGTVIITGTTGAGFTSITSTAITGTLQTIAQPNVTSLGTLTSLKVGNATPAVTSIETTITSPGTNLALATTEAIVDYINTKPAPSRETLAETLVSGNTTGGTDIAVSAADDITFTDTSKIILGTGSDATIEHDGTDLKIANVLGKTTISNTSGDIDISASAATRKLNLNGKAGVELQFDTGKKFETLTGGAKVTGAFQATTSGTFASLINTGTYSDSSGGVGTNGQLLSSTGTGTSWVTEVPLYNWSFEGTTIPSGTAVTVTDGNNITTTWDAASYALTIAASGDGVTGSGTNGQVAFWTGTQTESSGAGFTFAGGATGKVTVAGELEAATLSDGTFSGTAGTYTGGVSITSTNFVGALTGNATTATALAVPGTIQLLSGSGLTQGVASGAVTYTNGGNVQLTTSLANTTVTSKTLLNLPTPTSSAITAGDTVLEAMAKLQGQINATGGGGSIAYEGAWRASVTAVANGAVSSSTALVITTADANLVKGTVVEGAGITGTVRIDSIAGTSITLDTAITIANGITLTMSPPGGAITGATAGTAASLTTPANKVNGHFYICDTSGKAEPNAAVPWAAATTPNEWAVGDWVIYISSGTAADEWQKIDQSNEIFGSGAATKVALWTASNTLGTGLIADDGATVTIGANGNLTVLGDTILGDNAAFDTITLNGPTTFESTGIFKKGIALGAAGTDYGDGTKVLTSSGASGSPPTWTTPTTGTVTTVSATTAGDALDVAVTNPTTTPAIALTWAGGASGATKYVNGLGNLVTFPTVDSYVSWTADSDQGTDITVTSGFNLKFTGAVTSGGAGIATDSAVSANEMTIGLINAGGTPSATSFYRGDGQWAVPVGTKTETLSEVLVNGNTAGAKNIVFPDSTAATNGRVTFGASTDLEIYHDSNHGYVKTANGGDLKLEAADDIVIKSGTDGAANGNIYLSPNNGQNGIEIISGGAVKLFYDSGSPKIETTSTGATITGLTTLGGNAVIQGTLSMDGYVIYDIEELRFDQSNNQPRIKSVGTNGLDIEGANVSITGGGSNLAAAGNLTIAGDLTVNGSIIHGGGGGGTAKGGQFTKLYTTGNAGTAGVAFTISRATTGVMIFDVMLTSDTSTACAVAKKYTIVKSYGASPLYNKILDTGPDFDTSDFNVVFAQDTTDLSIKCTITPVYTNTQKIGITLDLGFGQHDATVVMN